MSSRNQISGKLRSLGYRLAKETNSYDRFGALFLSGSLYVKESYISATGDFKVVENAVPRTSSDPKGNPEWRGGAVHSALKALEKLSSGSEAPTQSDAETTFPAVPQAPTRSASPPADAQGAMADWNSTGIYIAYPTSPTLKPIYRGYTTMVNDRHTKVGIARDSFAARRNSYVGTFDGEVVFLPVAVIDAQHVEAIEQVILAKLCERFRRVGRAREWFDTTDREAFLGVIKEVTD
jgi:hypothetical protein